MPGVGWDCVIDPQMRAHPHRWQDPVHSCCEMETPCPIPRGTQDMSLRVKITLDLLQASDKNSEALIEVMAQSR